MKTKTITLYEYSELDKKSKENALNNWNEYNDDPLMQSHMLNLLKEKLEGRGIKYDTDSIDVRYSLSNCQGDGFMFIGEIVWGKYTVYLTHNDNHYYHSHTAFYEMQETSNPGYHIDEEDLNFLKFEKIYHSICKEMEAIGYEHIEHFTSEESFIEACEANEYTFREDGVMENV